MTTSTTTFAATLNGTIFATGSSPEQARARAALAGYGLSTACFTVFPLSAGFAAKVAMGLATRMPG